MSRLGLHTREERSKAHDLVLFAQSQAKSAGRDQDLEKFSFARGYLHAIRDLALQENAPMLVVDAERALEKISSYWD
jgi:hypothetical protein